MLTKLPATCECGTNFTVDHALSCKKGGFMSQRHNKVSEMTAKYLLSRQVCNNVGVEPILEDRDEEFLLRLKIQSNDARVDVSARGFWVACQKAFLDVMVFNPLAKRYSSLTPLKCNNTNEKEKKRTYNQRVFEVEHGSFAPLVFSAIVRMSHETKNLY